MEDNISDLVQARKEYDRFMSWFRENHLGLFEKYEENISIPFKPGGGIKVNSANNISVDEQNGLFNTINEYYRGQGQ